jgi:hypothetical protein
MNVALLTFNNAFLMRTKIYEGSSRIATIKNQFLSLVELLSSLRSRSCDKLALKHITYYYDSRMR